MLPGPDEVHRPPIEQPRARTFGLFLVTLDLQYWKLIPRSRKSYKIIFIHTYSRKRFLAFLTLKNYKAYVTSVPFVDINQLQGVIIFILDNIFIFRGKMIPEQLEKSVLEEIKKGKKPFFVNCTAGTTVIGAFDPIHPLADICEKYGMWLHVDVS